VISKAVGVLFHVGSNGICDGQSMGVDFLPYIGFRNYKRYVMTAPRVKLMQIQWYLGLRA
jgi:hypothetical protein